MILNQSTIDLSISCSSIPYHLLFALLKLFDESPCIRPIKSSNLWHRVRSSVIEDKLQPTIKQIDCDNSPSHLSVFPLIMYYAG